MRRHAISFRHAYEGIFYAFKSQPNFRVHGSLSFLALLLGFFFNITSLEWLVLILVICLGFTMEMVNTSLEAMTDLITSEYKKEAKIAKDVSAGMMLIYSLGAVVIALVIFLPRLIG